MDNRSAVREFYCTQHLEPAPKAAGLDKAAAPFEGRWVLHPSKSGTPATSYISVEALADAYADKAHAEVDPWGEGCCPNCGDDAEADSPCYIRDEIRDAYLAGLRAHA